MDEIKVVPYIPDEDYDNPAMVVDFYEFTMANCLFLHGFKDTTLVFDMFFRKNPDNQGYSISAGQRKLTRFLLNYHFNAQDIWWLRTKGMSEEFCEYLRTYRWKGDMYALPEGTVCYPHVQMVRIECDLVGAILIETYLLQTMNFHSLIATKATRVTGLNTHTPRSVMEFGTRQVALNADHLDMGVADRALGQGVHIAFPAVGVQVIAEFLAHALGAQPLDVLLIEVVVEQEAGQLALAGADGIAHVVRVLAEEHIEHKGGVLKAVQEQAVCHREFVEIHHHGRVIIIFVRNVRNNFDLVHEKFPLLVLRSSKKALPLLKKQPLLPCLCSGSAWACTLS